jgi:probable rRNA maturation factor
VLEFVVEPGLSAAWDEPRLSAVVSSLLPSSDARLTLHLVSDETIRALNRDHRGNDTHTDVLSFPLSGADFVLPPGEPVHLGDVVVSFPRAVEQASAYGHSLDRELAYLVAHGVLHLLGYDHEEEADRVLMRRREEEALTPLGFTRV